MKGTVFQPVAEGTHPWIIISDEHDGWVLAVNLSDATKHPNSSCIVKDGEHPAVTKDSAVVFTKALPMQVSKLQKGLKKYSTVFQEPCPAAVLERIIEGALADDSDLTLKLRVYLEQKNAATG